MPSTDPAAVLLDFEHWATHRMLDACAGLTDDQLDREFEMGLGTLRKNLVHNTGAMIGWTSVLEGREPEFTFDFGSDAPSIDRIREVVWEQGEAAALGSIGRVHNSDGSTHRERVTQAERGRAKP